MKLSFNSRLGYLAGFLMAGGLIGAVIGPNLANHSKALLSMPFAGAYLALGVLAIIALALVSQIDFPPVPEKTSQSSEGRPLAEIITSIRCLLCLCLQSDHQF